MYPLAFTSSASPLTKQPHHRPQHPHSPPHILFPSQSTPSTHNVTVLVLDWYIYTPPSLPVPSVQVERLLEGVDCVLYLLDYTKLKTAEEEGLFRRLRAINPQLVERLSSRLFFVINKVGCGGLRRKDCGPGGRE